MLTRLLPPVSFVTVFLAATAALSVATAEAGFMIDLTPGGDKFFNGAPAHKGVTSFTGNVGGQGSGPAVTVDTTGKVDAGAGFSTISPSKGASLTELVFTPADPTLFDDFAFSGQLLADAGGTVTLIVQDNQGDSPEKFTFTGLGANTDFGALGIVADPGSKVTIKWIELQSLFKEEKHNEFSYAPKPQGTSTVPEPTSVCIFGLLGLLLFLYRRPVATALVTSSARVS